MGNRDSGRYAPMQNLSYPGIRRRLRNVLTTLKTLQSLSKDMTTYLRVTREKRLDSQSYLSYLTRYYFSFRVILLLKGIQLPSDLLDWKAWCALLCSTRVDDKHIDEKR
ncbi:hypothetical protein Y032_0026g1296 [Ancylostoma ceylanicum]|uniref:Uncharacterized protein n=1 Tax=Ancylostoma ceylanicum TaxID=53326 RepID=A0A016UV34_9BILA|nr:hypothetical protein Y032_0026g1296 [Ancylostoma ceylanicum]